MAVSVPWSGPAFLAALEVLPATMDRLDVPLLAPLRAATGILTQPIDRLAVAGEDLAGALARQVGREGAEGIVEVPVRVVGGEQQPVPADPFHGAGEVRAVVRLLHGLGGEPDVLADVFRRPPLQVRNLRAQALVELVEA